MANPLLSKRCIPCEGGVPSLTEDEAKELLPQVPGWKIKEDSKAIEKNINFSDFVDAIVFINDVAQLSEEEGHHPDISLYDYNKVLFRLSTHAIKGLSENDFILAAKINVLLDDHEGNRS